MNVLVVDDDVAIRTLVTRLFARRGDKVQSAADGEAAISCLESDTFDLVVLDLMMPRTDGFGVLSYLEARQEPKPRVIVMTAAVPALVQRVPEELVIGVIAKPFDLSTLLDLVEDSVVVK
jgi:DNA-binding response OmpR family regulator